MSGCFHRVLKQPLLRLSFWEPGNVYMPGLSLLGCFADGTPQVRKLAFPWCLWNVEHGASEYNYLVIRTNYGMSYFLVLDLECGCSSWHGSRFLARSCCHVKVEMVSWAFPVPVSKFPLTIPKVNISMYLYSQWHLLPRPTSCTYNIVGAVIRWHAHM